MQFIATVAAVIHRQIVPSALIAGNLRPVSEPDFVTAPVDSRLRSDVRLGQLSLAVARALEDKLTTRSAWQELALLVDANWILNGQLLEAHRHGDDDYRQLIHEIVPAVLGLRRVEDSWGNTSTYVDHLAELEEYLDLPAWLAEHQPRLHRLLYGADLAEAAALDAVTAAIADLKLPEIVRQLDRLHRDLADDLPAAVGHAKDLVESACKTVIGQTGPGAGTEFPAVVTAALKAVGRHAQQVDSRDPDAQLLRRLFGALQGQLEAVAGLRNRVGTGHGRAGDVALDAPLARLVVGQALIAVGYLLHAADLNVIDGGTLDNRAEGLVIDGGTL